jgi:hypothetical protein
MSNGFRRRRKRGRVVSKPNCSKRLALEQNGKRRLRFEKSESKIREMNRETAFGKRRIRAFDRSTFSFEGSY